MLSEALLAERDRAAGEKAFWQRNVAYLEDLNRRARAEVSSIPTREAALAAEVADWETRFAELAHRMSDLQTRAAAFSDRVVDTPKGLVLEYDSRAALAALREVL